MGLSGRVSLPGCQSPGAWVTTLLGSALCVILSACDSGEPGRSGSGNRSSGGNLRIMSAKSKAAGKNMGNQPMLEVRAEIKNTGAAPVNLYILHGHGMKYGPTENDKMMIRLAKEENPDLVVPFGLGLEERHGQDDEWRPAATTWRPEGEPPKPVPTMLTEQVVLAPGQTRAFVARVLSPEDAFGAKFFRVFLLDPECVRLDEMEVSP